jgi:tetratricopeptide (TPR) repeat protein
LKINKDPLCIVSIAAFAILISAWSGYAAEGELQVACVDPSGNSVKGVKVTAFSFNANKEESQTSDSDGKAKFEEIEDGLYRVSGHKKGYAPAFYEYIAFKGSVPPIKLTFTPGDDRKLYFEDPAENERVKAMIRQGMDAVNNGKYEDAESLVHEALQISPYSPDALYYFGTALIAQYKFDEGVEFLDRATATAEKWSTAGPQGMAEAGKSLINFIQQTRNKDLPALRGESLLKQDKYAEAIKYFEEATRNDPSNAVNYANMAVAMARLNRFDEALTWIEKACLLRPEEGKYSVLKDQIANLKKAKEENEAFVKSGTLINEGDKQLLDEDYADAIEKYEEAKEMVAVAKQSPLWVRIGQANAKLHQNAAAIAAYKSAIECAPEEDKAKYQAFLERYYIQNKHYDEAIELKIGTPPASPDNEERILLEMAAANKDTNPAFAEVALERALKLNPEAVDAYFDLGQLYYLDGKSQDSRTKELLTKYLEIGKDALKLQRAKEFLKIVNRRSP